jgi:hypothetical protein
VARYAVGQRLNFVFFDQLAPQFGLIRRVNVIDIKHFGLGPDVFFRLPVAVDAPIHVEGIHAIHQRHLVHPAVAGGASYALVDVNAVIEIDKVR